LERKLLFDACASWWTVGLGHGESSLALAAAAAAGRYGHVIFPEVVHAPAVTLCQRLLGESGPGHGWANRVFFSDDGSTAMEIAIKMGMKKFCSDRGIDIMNVGKPGSTVRSLSVCAQKYCYHGDTLGAMNVAESNVFNQGQHPWFQSKGLFLNFPRVSFMSGELQVSYPTVGDNIIPLKMENMNSIADVYDIESRLSSTVFDCYYGGIKQQWEEYENGADSR